MDYGMTVDPIQKWYFITRNWAMVMPDAHYWLVFRLMMVVAVPTILMGFAFKNGSRSIIVQIICLTAGVLIALVIPFAHPPQHPDIKTWTFVFASVLLAVTPAILPFFLTPRYGLQNKIRIILYCGIGIVFLVEIL